MWTEIYDYFLGFLFIGILVFFVTDYGMFKSIMIGLGGIGFSVGFDKLIQKAVDKYL